MKNESMVENLSHMLNPPVLTKQLFLLSSVKTSGIFFQIFVAFSEKLDFRWNIESMVEKK